MDLSPRMRFYFRWGQKCALFRAAPIIAVEERRRGCTHRGSCNFFWAIYTGVQWARTVASCHMETRQQVLHVPLECGACEFPVSLRAPEENLSCKAPPCLLCVQFSQEFWTTRAWSSWKVSEYPATASTPVAVSSTVNSRAVCRRACTRKWHVHPLSTSLIYSTSQTIKPHGCWPELKSYNWQLRYRTS